MQRKRNLLLLPLLFASCVIFPVPIPHYSRESMPSGSLILIDKNSREVIPEALFLVVRKHTRGEMHTGKSAYTINQLIEFQAGDEVLVHSRRGVNIIFLAGLFDADSEIDGFIVLAPGYLPAYFKSMEEVEPKSSVEWELDEGTIEGRTEALSQLNSQLAEGSVDLSPFDSSKNGPKLLSVKLAAKEIERIAILTNAPR